MCVRAWNADILDTGCSGELDWAQVASFVAATSANSAIGASDFDPDEVKASMHALDEDGNGTVSRDEWHKYINSVYKMRAERVALRRIVAAQMETASGPKCKGMGRGGGSN